MYHAVTNVEHIEDYKLIITFDNEEKRLLDMEPYLDLDYFKDLREQKVFDSVHPCYDCIEWINAAWVDAPFILEESTPIN